MKRICFVFNPPKAYEVIMGKTGGGGEKLQYYIAKELKNRGYDIIFIIEKKGTAKITKTTINGFVTYLIPPMNEGIFLIKHIKFLFNFFIALKKSGAKYIFQVTPTFSSGLLSLYSRLFGKRYILYNSSDILSTYGYKTRYKWYFVPFVRLSYNLATCVVAQHNVQKNNFKQYFGVKTSVIGNLIYIKDYERRKRTHFLWVGTNAVVKRQYLIIEIAKSLPEIKFVIVSNSICTNNYPNNIDFRKNVSDKELFDLYNSSLGIINTSITEGIPNTFLEQWMMGGIALSLSSDVGGVLRKYDYLGKCFYGDIDIMKKNIYHIWKQYSNKDYFCDRCREYVIRNHSPEVIISYWEKIFNSY